MEVTEENPKVGSDCEENNRRKMGGFWGFVWRPIHWFKMLCKELHWTFVLGVMIVYGASQGVGVGLSRVSTQYYLKDEQKLQPSEAQVYFGVILIPWIVKPLWGLLTDTLPILGHRRRPYFFLAGTLLLLYMTLYFLPLFIHLMLVDNGYIYPIWLVGTEFVELLGLLFLYYVRNLYAAHVHKCYE